MIGYLTLNKLFANLFATGIIDKIYHDVTIIENESGNRYPAYKQGDDYVYVGVDDTKLMSCYLRQTGPLVNLKSDFVTSNRKLYNIRVPYRLVLFNDFENRRFDDIYIAIAKVMYTENVFLDKMLTDTNELLRLETTPKGFSLGGKTFYTAFDFNLQFKLTGESCPFEIRCDDLPNPICSNTPIPKIPAMQNIFHLVYTATGNEGNSITIPDLLNKEIQMLFRESFLQYEVAAFSADPAEKSTQFLWANSSYPYRTIELGTPTNFNERFYFVYSKK